MNRAPGKSDTWWASHLIDCGGTYTKIQEPAPTKKQIDAMSKKERAGRQKNKLDSWVKNGPSVGAKAKGKTLENPINLDEDDISTNGLVGKRKAESASGIVEKSQGRKKVKQTTGPAEGGGVISIRESPVECPICSVQLVESEINQHLDVVHPT